MFHLSRDIEALKRETFDVLVIGGGVVGAASAREAAFAGLKVALVEQDDFGGATSAGCFKVVHGGLRYLQHFDLVRLRESMSEQWSLRRLAPHLVRPLPFLIPCYGFGKRGKRFLQTGMALYELFSIDRNWGFLETEKLPRHSILSKRECIQRAPGINQVGLKGGVVYYDSQMVHCERLTLAFVVDAARRGARVANYARVESLGLENLANGDRKISKVTCCDRESGNRFDIKAKFIVNAAGPWIGEMLTKIDPHLVNSVPNREVFSKGIQIVLPSLGTSCAVAVESSYNNKETFVTRGGRSYFIIPWRNFSLVGTADHSFTGKPGEFRISKGEIEEFVSELSELYQSPKIDSRNVFYAFGGLRPATKRYVNAVESGSAKISGSVEVELHDQILDHTRRSNIAPSIVNLISAMGVKYTTARALAQRTVNRICQVLSFPRLQSDSGQEIFEEGKIGLLDNYLERVSKLYPEISREAIKRLVHNYGTSVESVLGLMRESRSLGVLPNPKDSTLGCEIVYAVRYESACHLRDVVRRRTDLGNVTKPGESSLRLAAELVGAEMGWDKQRVEQEILETLTSYSNEFDSP